jgi:hypothetical protein
MLFRSLVTASFTALAITGSVAVAQQKVPERAPAAAAQTVDVGGRQIRLPLPEGQCLLDRNQNLDRQVLDLASRAIAGSNEMLMHSAECNNLKNARVGKDKYLNDFAQVQVALQFKSTELKGQEAGAAKEICQSLRVDGDKIEKQVGGEIKDRVKNLQAGISVNETKALGVLGEDQTACYSGLLMKIQTPQGDTRLIMGVYAMGVINGRLLFLYRFQAEPQPGAVDRMVELQKKAMTDTLAANQAGLLAPPVKK